MAKSATAKKAPDGKKKTKKDAPAATVRIKVKAKKANKDGKAGKKAHKAEGFAGLAKLVDHPLVADLLAAGALAAVAAIADHKMGGKDHGSSKMVKSVGKAAAAAMGKRLFADIGAIGGAAAAAAKKA